MDAPSPLQKLRSTLADLERLLAEESAVLRAMKREELDLLTERKLELWRTLQDCLAHALPEPEDRAALERLRHAALLNQILLHHARDAVRTILLNATGQALALAPSSRPQAIQGGSRIDWRG